MVTNLADSRKVGQTALKGTFGPARFWSLVALCAVLALCIAFSWATRDAMAHMPFLNSTPQRGSGATPQTGVVDTRPWQIAQALSPLAASREEEQYAREAERLAGYEVDQAFAAALRQATVQHTAPSGEMVALTQRITQFEQTTREDQARVRSLTPQAGAPETAAGQDDLKIAQAQLDLDQDELNDAQQDMARTSGDVRSQIQQELAAHQAATAKAVGRADGAMQLAVLSTRQYATLAGRLEAWINQRTRYDLIQQALQQARADAAGLTLQHNALESIASAGDASVSAAPPDSSRLASLQRRRQQRQLLTLYDDRIQTQQQLAAVYNKWAAQVLLQHRIVMHMGMQSLATVAFILICAIVCETLGTRLLEHQNLDRRRKHTLRTILRLSVQLVGLACVLLVTFGIPSQISTILGLTTAGLTVALQSYILAFFGWFILMGTSGIRVGDYVQINGVAGEVVEITLFRTTILETSNWAEKGHPTGRRATFINNFAITGQFFNFSTVGQWMWDEISVSIPASAESYAKVALLQKAVDEETGQDSQLAEEEWKRLPRKNGMSHANASALVNLRPVGAGVDVLIRYVTRAADRLTVRNRLYERVIEVLHKPQAIISTKEPSKLTSAVLAAADPADQDSRDIRASI